MSTKAKILEVLRDRPGLTDRELAEHAFGKGTPQQRVNGLCRELAAEGLLLRQRRNTDNLIGNFVVAGSPIPAALPVIPPLTADHLGEDQLKHILNRWLEQEGWTTEVAWGRTRGIDIKAIRSGQSWIIEAKGQGSLPAMRVNYFLCMIGELLQRMTDPQARYSIALPDIAQFRGLWNRLPRLAKERTGITAIFVTHDGRVAIDS